MASERGAAVAWAFMVLALLVLASQLREGSMDAAGRVELAASAAAASTTPTQTTTDAPQNYGPYYGPQAYYDGELHALSLPQSLNLSRCLLDLEGGELTSFVALTLQGTIKPTGRRSRVHTTGMSDIASTETMWVDICGTINNGRRRPSGSSETSRTGSTQRH